LGFFHPVVSAAEVAGTTPLSNLFFTCLAIVLK